MEEEAPLPEMHAVGFAPSRFLFADRFGVSSQPDNA